MTKRRCLRTCRHDTPAFPAFYHLIPSLLAMPSYGHLLQARVDSHESGKLSRFSTMCWEDAQFIEVFRFLHGEIFDPSGAPAGAGT